MSFELSPWLHSLLWASFYGSALALAVLVLQWVLRGHVPARWRFVLWLLVLVRFVPVTLPESRMSAFNWLPHQGSVVGEPEVVSRQTVVALTDAIDSAVVAVPAIAEASAGVVYQTSDELSPAVVTVVATPPRLSFFNLIYGVGAAWVFIRVAVATLSLRGMVRRSVPVVDASLVEMLASVCRVMGVRRVIPLLATEELASPAVVGFFRPRLLIPSALVGKLSVDEFRMVFLHEAAHIRRGDVLLNYGFALLEMVHWFNPVVWLMVPRMRADREMACDELVLMHTTDPAPYGHTLLKLLEIAGPGRTLAPAVGIMETKAFFTRRIRMIATFPQTVALDHRAGGIGLCSGG